MDTGIYKSASHRKDATEISTSRNSGVIFGIQTKDRRRLKCIAYYVIIQCILVFAGIATVLYCVWKPEEGYFELDILARIMYLYDTNACGKTRSLKQFKGILLSNDTYGLDIIPIRHEPVFLNVLTKLSGKTRSHMKFSLGLHIIWMFAALLLWSFSSIENMKVLKIILHIFRYATISNAIYDVCMAIVYGSHIQQSLTKAMIIRYAGWGMTPRAIAHPEEFGGWVPIMASGLWLRGGVFFCLNLYLIRFVRLAMQKIRGKEVKSRLSTRCNVPFPEANYQNMDRHWGSLYYRAGEYDKF